MTVPSTQLINQYIGTGSLATYAFTFRTFEASDLQIWEQPSGGAPAQKTVGVDYTVSGAGSYTGGTVTRVAGNLPSGTRLTLKPVIDLEQGTDLRNQGAYLAETQEVALDRLTMMAKQIDEKVSRAILAPDTDSALNKMPPASERALQTLAFDASGHPIAAGVSTAVVSTAMQPVVAAELPAARAAMGPWGDALVTATGGTTARSLAARAADVVNVLDFGADPTAMTDSGTAIQSALNYACTAGKTLYFPAGRYWSTAQIVQTGKSVSIVGAGSGNTSLLFTNSASAGLSFTGMNPVSNGDKHTVLISGISLLAGQGNCGTAINLSWTNTGGAHRYYTISDVSITYWVYGSTYWTRALDVSRAFCAVIEDFYIIGTAGQGITSGIRFLDQCVSCSIRNAEIWGAATAFICGVNVQGGILQCEGILFSHCAFYNVGIGLSVNQGIQVNYQNSHIQATVQVLNYTASNQTDISHNLFYCNNASAGAIACLLDSTGNTTFAHNTITGGANNVGVQLQNSCNFVVVSGNTMAHVGTCVVLKDATTANNIVDANTAWDVATAYVVHSSDGENQVSNWYPNPGGTTVALNSSTPDVGFDTIYYTNSSVPTNITNLLNGYNGKVVTFVANDNNTTFVNSASLNCYGGINYNIPINRTITFHRENGKWRERNRN